jgi:hypothetical protein
LEAPEPLPEEKAFGLPPVGLPATEEAPLEEPLTAGIPAEEMPPEPFETF